MAAVGAVATPVKADVPDTVRLPLPMVPDTVKPDKAPNEVMLGWAAVVSTPARLVAVRLPRAVIDPSDNKLPAVTLPVVLTGFELSAPRLATTLALPYMPVSWLPFPRKFAAVILPVAETIPTVLKLAAVTLPAADINPDVKTLPPVTVPVADITPVVLRFPACTLPVALIWVALTLGPSILPNDVTDTSDASPAVTAPVAEMLPNVRRFPACTLPVTERLTSEPTLVIAGCAGVDKIPARVVPLIKGAATVPVADTEVAPMVLTTVRLTNCPTCVILV